MRVAREYQSQSSHTIYQRKTNKQHIYMTDNRVNNGVIQRQPIVQLMPVNSKDIYSWFNVRHKGNVYIGKLMGIDNGWYHFQTNSGLSFKVHGNHDILSSASSVTPTVAPTFMVDNITFTQPPSNYFEFTISGALNAIQSTNGWTITGLPRHYGVTVGDIGSYGYVRYLEKTGDGLTGDHQPSGAAIKEAIRESLHAVLPHRLTRNMAKNAYDKAITIVVEETWHRSLSRTYGGRNTYSQIQLDAKDLVSAAIEDWKLVVPHLKSKGLSDSKIEEIWDKMNTMRSNFAQTGQPQWR